MFPKSSGGPIKPSGSHLRVGSRRLTTTPVFDTYWRFACERQLLFFRRVSGETPPWTVDPIIAEHRFTNVYRASDRVSQYLIRNVIYDGEQSEPEVFFRTMLFKLFNKISTWEHLREELGEIRWSEFSFARYRQVLDRLFSHRETVYSAAYIMPSPAFGEIRKHSNHLRLLEHMMRDQAPQKVASTRSLRDLFHLLKGYPSLGDFLAFQLAIDLNYSAITNFSEREFVVAGPGARDGISKCFTDLAGFSDEDVIRAVTEHADGEFERLGLRFSTLWGRPLQLIDCQNVFCELSKYARVAHPEIAGLSGRTRIKQKYTPSEMPVPQWYPPKWQINEAIVAPSAKISRGVLSKRKPLQRTFEDITSATAAAR